MFSGWCLWWYTKAVKPMWFRWSLTHRLALLWYMLSVYCQRDLEGKSSSKYSSQGDPAVHHRTSHAPLRQRFWGASSWHQTSRLTMCHHRRRSCRVPLSIVWKQTRSYVPPSENKSANSWRFEATPCHAPWIDTGPAWPWQTCVEVMPLRPRPAVQQWGRSSGVHAHTCTWPNCSLLVHMPYLVYVVGRPRSQRTAPSAHAPHYAYTRSTRHWHLFLEEQNWNPLLIMTN